MEGVTGLIDAGAYVNPDNLDFNDFSCNGDDHCINNRCIRHTFHWDNTTVLVFQQVRDEHDGPIEVTSCYRCPRYNVTLAGSSLSSRHIAGDAFDFDNVGIHIEGIGTTEAERNWAVALSAEAAGVPLASILLYPGRGEGLRRSLQSLQGDNFNAQRRPPGWSTYGRGHISTHDTEIRDRNR